MLSAAKNFALTFIISLLVFSLLAYFIVGYALNNLMGIAGGSDTSETTTAPAPVITDSNGGIIDIDLPDTGTSFNLLLVLTDYEPSLYAYDPAVLETIFGKRMKRLTSPRRSRPTLRLRVMLRLSRIPTPRMATVFTAITVIR